MVDSYADTPTENWNCSNQGSKCLDSGRSLKVPMEGKTSWPQTCTEKKIINL